MSAEPSQPLFSSARGYVGLGAACGLSAGVFTAARPDVTFASVWTLPLFVLTGALLGFWHYRTRYWAQHSFARRVARLAVVFLIVGLTVTDVAAVAGIFPKSEVMTMRAAGPLLALLLGFGAELRAARDDPSVLTPRDMAQLLTVGALCLVWFFTLILI